MRECLLYHLMEETGLRGLSPVHRIDRHTAGLVLLSIHENERAFTSPRVLLPLPGD